MTAASTPREAAYPAGNGPRSIYGLMVDRTFGPFFWGKIFSSAGIWVHNIVAALVAYQLSGSAFVVGLVTAVQFAPQLVLAPLSGKMADRGNAPRQIVTGRVLTGLGSLLLAGWLWLAGGVEQMSGTGPVLASSLVVGLGFVVGGPAMQSIIPRIIRPGELPAAMTLNGVPMTTARAVGPALGALLATGAGPEVAFLAAGICNVGYGLVMLSLRLPRWTEEHTQDTDYSVRTALRHVRRDTRLMALLVAVAAVGIAAEPAITLAPSIATDLGAGDRAVGWIASAFGIGSGLGFLVFGRLLQRTSLPVVGAGGLGLMAAGLLLVTLSPATAPTLLCFGISGTGMTLAFTSTTTQVQDRIPETLRGRIMALWMMAFLGARPVAGAVIGFLADHLALSVALLAPAVVALVAAYLTRPGAGTPAPEPTPTLPPD